MIGTRPDCVDDEKLDLLAELARKRYVAVEYGVESTCDETLRAVRRGHDFAAARQVIAASAARGLHVGAHFILGLPGEDDEMLLRQVERINALPLETVKFHQLQLVRGTTLAAQYDAEPGRFRLRTSEEYLAGGRGVAAAASRYGCGAYRQRSADGISPLDAVAFNAGFHPLVPA